MQAGDLCGINALQQLRFLMEGEGRDPVIELPPLVRQLQPMRAAIIGVGQAQDEASSQQTLRSPHDGHFVHDGPIAQGLLSHRSLLSQHRQHPPLGNGDLESFVVDARNQS